MITTVILSKDRPAQLDLLLRSLERNGGGQFTDKHLSPAVIIGGEGVGYGSMPSLLFEGMVLPEYGAGSFEVLVREVLLRAGEFVCFMCDDGILYRPLPPDFDVCHDEYCLCTSLRLGDNTRHFYPGDFPNTMPGSHLWPWKLRDWQEAGDFYYPGSIDAHIFRTADVQRMLEGKTFPNPTALECALVAGCLELAAERPLMACYPHSVYVGNPINRVSAQSGVRYGQRFPVSAAECAERFAAGQRIDLDALDFSGVNGAHTEVELRWC